MSLDGLRAWIGEVERKLGMRTRVFLVLATIAIGGAGAAIYLALDTRDDAVSESDVRALQERLEERIAAGGTTGAAESGGIGAVPEDGVGGAGGIAPESAQGADGGATADGATSKDATGGRPADGATTDDGGSAEEAPPASEAEAKARLRAQLEQAKEKSRQAEETE
jgi:hypothetical protein